MIRWWMLLCGMYLTFVADQATAGAVYVAAFCIITSLRKTT